MVGKWDESSVWPWHRDEIRGNPAVWTLTVSFGVHVFNFAHAHTHAFVLLPTLRCCLVRLCDFSIRRPHLLWGRGQVLRWELPLCRGAGLLQDMPRARAGIFSCRENAILTLNHHSSPSTHRLWLVEMPGCFPLWKPPGLFIALFTADPDHGMCRPGSPRIPFLSPAAQQPPQTYSAEQPGPQGST